MVIGGAAREGCILMSLDVLELPEPQPASQTASTSQAQASAAMTDPISRAELERRLEAAVLPALGLGLSQQQQQQEEGKEGEESPLRRLRVSARVSQCVCSTAECAS